MVDVFRCGYMFCYTCGAQWKLGGCSHRGQMETNLIIAKLSFVYLIIIICFLLIDIRHVYLGTWVGFG